MYGATDCCDGVWVEKLLIMMPFINTKFKLDLHSFNGHTLFSRPLNLPQLPRFAVLYLIKSRVYLNMIPTPTAYMALCWLAGLHCPATASEAPGQPASQPASRTASGGWYIWATRNRFAWIARDQTATKYWGRAGK